ILRLDEPTDGFVEFDGEDLLRLSQRNLRKRRKALQISFQDPYASLNPYQTAGRILTEAMAIQKIGSSKERRDRAIELLETVGLSEEHLDRYPHEFSGGQRQRVGIARALAVNPRLIVCDEAVSALDVSVQAQVLNLLNNLQREFNLTYLLIAHHVAAVRHISDRIIVMYLGKIVEIADKKSLFDNPQHPYTKALLSAIPVPDPEIKKERITLKGDVPSPIDPPKGCRFHTRCPFATDLCREEEPELRNLDPMAEGHKCACHYIPKLREEQLNIKGSMQS